MGIYQVSLMQIRVDIHNALNEEQHVVRHDLICHSQLSKVLDHQVAADVKGDFLSNFLYI